MATGLDALIDFLLSEIALCGTQGMWVRSSNPSLTICPYILLLNNFSFDASM
jgi:hypothetical protein